MSLIPEEMIAQVLDRSDIVEVISGYIPLKRAGRNFKAPCPFHNEKTPSFIVSPDKQIFHCFGCGAGGNVISFVMKQESVEFPEAVRMLASKCGVVIPEKSSGSPRVKNLKQSLYDINHMAVAFFHKNLLEGNSAGAGAARKYLQERKISLESVRRFKLGYASDSWDSLLVFLRSQGISLNLMEKGGLIISRENKSGFYDRFRDRIMFPVFDVRWRCVGFGARTLKQGDSGAKYINSPETPVYVKGEHLYGLCLTKDAIREKDFAIVVEGYMDCITSFQSGVQNIVASSGTALTAEQIRLMRRYSCDVMMLFDSDKAGQEATLRSLDLLVDEDLSVKVATLDPGEDPDSFIRKKEIKEFEKRLDCARSLFDYKLDILMGRYSHKSVEGKALICQKILPTIKKYKNAVLRFGYVRKLAQALSIGEEVLLVEMQKISDDSPLEPMGIRLKDKISSKPFRGVEHDLLRLILEDGRHIALVKAELELTDFQDEKIREILSKILRMAGDGRKISVSELLSSIDDESMREMISRFIILEPPFVADREKLCRDYIVRIKDDQLKIRRRRLSEQIKLAEMSGDKTALDKLRFQFNQLIKR